MHGSSLRSHLGLFAYIFYYTAVTICLNSTLWTEKCPFDMPKIYRELGIGIVPYSPLGHGFFGGKAVIESVPANSFLVCSTYLS